MTNHARFVDKASERVCMTNVNGFVDRLQEEEYLYMGVCACTSRDLRLYMPLMLPYHLGKLHCKVLTTHQTDTV